MVLQSFNSTKPLTSKIRAKFKWPPRRYFFPQVRPFSKSTKMGWRWHWMHPNGERACGWVKRADEAGWGLFFRVTCMLGRGRGRVPAHDLRSSSRARLSISNCLSCSRTEASREAVLAHCSIHMLRAEHRTGQGRVNTRQKERFNQHRDLIKGETHSKAESPK